MAEARVVVPAVSATRRADGEDTRDLLSTKRIWRTLVFKYRQGHFPAHKEASQLRNEKRLNAPL